MHDNDHWKTLACTATGATNAEYTESVQSLWSGYGEIFRARLTGTDTNSIIVKHVAPPDNIDHPRGWSSDYATQRKLSSYDNEANWYQQWSTQCTTNCRVAECYGIDKIGQTSWILLEDLDAAGYPIRYSGLNRRQAIWCLQWLANFHATFLSTKTADLWPVGTYWHLDTRPDEFRAMASGPVKDNAALIDAMLNECQYQTLVHGDAKVANFCFSKESDVAAVDFQYVGGGCGMKDVAYFIGSCFSEQECEQYAEELVDKYFIMLEAALNKRASNGVGITWDFNELEAEWRQLYPVAWTDFYRFLLGWMPTHQKIHRYTRDLANTTIQLITERTAP